VVDAFELHPILLVAHEHSRLACRLIVAGRSSHRDGALGDRLDGAQ
jgi:hypothetical protein